MQHSKFPASKRTLENCQFLKEDDLQYLLSDEDWIHKKSEKLREQERPQLQDFLHQLHHTDSYLINVSFVNDFFQNLFNTEYVTRLHQERRKVEVKSIFLATIIRELLLRTETAASMMQSRTTFLERFSFLKDQEGSEIELTWLHRFERAMRYLLPLLTPVGNKQYFLAVGTQLQGSDIYVEYVTGGSNRPETQRRVDLFETLTNVKPKPRAPKNFKKNQPCSEQSEVKRGRGRPRKNPLSNPANRKETPMVSQETDLIEMGKTFRLEEQPLKPFRCPSSVAFAALEVEMKEEDDLYNLTDDEFFHRIMSYDEETNTEMDLFAAEGDDLSVRTPIIYSSPQHLQHRAIPSHFTFDFADSVYSQLSFQEMEAKEFDYDEENFTTAVANYLNASTFDEAEIIGKKRTLSLNDPFLDEEDLELLLAMDADDEAEEMRPVRSVRSPTQQHKRLIALHRSRGFAKIPVNELVPLSTMPHTEATEFPNRSIISYRFNVASVSSHDSTDLSTVESIDPEESDDEIVNDIDACFEGLLI